MTAVVYQVKTVKDAEVVLFQGIVRHREDTIYPAQEEPYYLEEFPDLPYEVELHHFKVDGLVLEVFEIDIPFKILLKYKV